MNESLYFELVNRYFPSLVLSIMEKINDKNAATALTYLYRDFLTPKYAADGRWASITAEYSRVAADVVAMSSPLPVKSRDTIETSAGKLPKIGAKFELSEQEMKNIDNLLRQPNPSISLVTQNVFQDTPRAITAILERIEDMFLSGLSSGCALAPRGEGLAVRVDYGYKDSNKFGVTTDWNDEPATCIDDITRLIEKATLEDGNTPIHIFADDWKRHASLTPEGKRRCPPRTKFL